MQIEYSKSASKYINALDRTTKQRIKEAVEGLMETPPKGDIKRLQGYSKITYRLRIGRYRVIYRYDLDRGKHKILIIADVDSRGDVYK